MNNLNISCSQSTLAFKLVTNFKEISNSEFRAETKYKSIAYAAWLRSVFNDLEHT